MLIELHILFCDSKNLKDSKNKKNFSWKIHIILQQQLKKKINAIFIADDDVNNDPMES